MSATVADFKTSPLYFYFQSALLPPRVMLFASAMSLIAKRVQMKIKRVSLKRVPRVLADVTMV